MTATAGAQACAAVLNNGGDGTALDFAHWRVQAQARIEQQLRQHTSLSSLHSERLNDLQQILQYAVLDGGKRLRPLLVLAGFHCAQSALAHPADADAQALVWDAACAVELIHAYSLVHDDMPCMDNDLLRRGKATVHAAYGEANALLAGDCLHALAFEVLLRVRAKSATATQTRLRLLQCQVRLSRLLALAAGAGGMAGGQFMDLQALGQNLGEAQLRQMHALKTGALIEASVVMGAICAMAMQEANPHPRALELALQQFGRHLGLLYQVVDDILDATQDCETLGKTAGKDAAQNKPTYVTVLKLEGAQAVSDDLFTQAQSALVEIAKLGANIELLRAMLGWVTQRVH